MTDTARSALLAELLAGEDPAAEEYGDAVARLEAVVDAAIAEGIRNARADAFNEAISRFNNLANLAPGEYRAGLSFAIGSLMAMRDRCSRKGV